MPERQTFLSMITGSFSTLAAENPIVAMIEAAYEHHHIDARYLNCDVAPEALGDAVRGARAMGWVGFNCSMPHKVYVIKYLDGLGSSAALIGAVNCVVRRDNRYIVLTWTDDWTQRGAHRSPGSCSQYLDKSNDRISCHEVFTILSGDPQLQLSTSLLESHGANCELEFRSQLRGRKLEILLKKLVTCICPSIPKPNRSFRKRSGSIGRCEGMKMPTRPTDSMTCTRKWAPEHLKTVFSLNGLDVLYAHTGEYAKAEPLDQEALRISQKVLGSEHPNTALSLSRLGGLYELMGEYAKAEPLDLETLRIRQKVLGSEHPDTATSLNNLGELY